MTEPTPKPFTIRIFLAQGKAEGLKIIWPSHWSGRGLAFPKTAFPEIKHRREFSAPGVYVLVGPSEEADIPHIYIGEADEIGTRLETHVAETDFWTWVMFFVSNDGSLNKAGAKYIEHKLYKMAKQGQRALLEQNTPQDVTLSESDEADAESFLSEMLNIFPLVGLDAFETTPLVPPKDELLVLEGKGITAEGFESNQGFVVIAGSHAVADEVGSLFPQPRQLRKQLRDQGLLVADGGNLKLTQDYIFNSPTLAAQVLLANTSNGRDFWKDRSGKTLKEIQEAKAQDTP